MSGERIKFYASSRTLAFLSGYREISPTINRALERYEQILESSLPTLPLKVWERVLDYRLDLLNTRELIGDLRSVLEDIVIHDLRVHPAPSAWSDATIIAVMDAVDRWRSLPYDKRKVQRIIPKEKISG